MLNNYRRRKGLSIPELAEQSTVPERDVRRFERGTHAPDIAELFKLAAVYGVPAWKIMKRVRWFTHQLERESTSPGRAAL